MRTKFPALLCLAFFLGLLSNFALAQQPVPAFAQTAETAAAEDVPGAETPGSLPHLKFLLDYLLVAVLLAGALYAVGRSSRRV